MVTKTYMDGSKLRQFITPYSLDTKIDAFCELTARWWNTLLEISPPDAGSWPTRICPTYDTEGDLISIQLSDDGIGWASLNVAFEHGDESIIRVKGEIKAWFGEGSFETKDLLHGDDD